MRLRNFPQVAQVAEVAQVAQVAQAANQGVEPVFDSMPDGHRRPGRVYSVQGVTESSPRLDSLSLLCLWEALFSGLSTVVFTQQAEQ